MRWLNADGVCAGPAGAVHEATCGVPANEPDDPSLAPDAGSRAVPDALAAARPPGTASGVDGPAECGV